MLFSIVIDFSVSPASQSKERLTGETSVKPLSFSLGCVSGRVGVNSQPSLAVLEVWEKDGLELCQSLGLESELLAPGGLDQLYSTGAQG